MNTGLLLKKPGESPYSRYRRFIVSNHGCYKTPTVLRKSLIDTRINIEDIPLTEGVILTSDISTKYELEKIQNNKLNIGFPSGSIPRYFRPRKHCPKCTDLLYHSILFELPWITTCPLHKDKLIDKCNKCEQELPSSCQLMFNHCSSCGTKINIREIIRRHHSINNSDFKIFEALNVIATVDTRLYSTGYFLDRYKDESHRKPINSNSSFYPSLLFEKKINIRVLTKALKLKIIYKYDVSRRGYRLKDNVDIKESYQSDLILRSKVIKKITKRIEKILIEENHGHHLGQCLDHNHSENDICTTCEVYGTWRSLIPYEVQEYLDFEANYFHQCSSLDNWLWSSNQEDAEFPDPVYYIDFPDSEKEHIKIPRKMTEKIYEIDLWTEFLHIYHLIKRINYGKSIGLSNVSEYNNLLYPLAEGENIPFCPYYISKKNNTLTVQYPKIIEENQLNSPLIRLLCL